MGAPTGNNNSSKDNRLWANTIRRAIVQGDPEKLRKIADKLIEMAADGDLAAIKELGDRLDGRSAQVVDGKIEHEHSGSIAHYQHRASETASQRVAELFGAGPMGDQAPLQPH